GEHRGDEEEPVGVVLRAAPQHHGGDVSAHRHEPGVADGELTGEAVHQIQRDRQDHGDADVVDVLEDVLEPERRVELDLLLDQHQKGDGDEERKPAPQRLAAAPQRAPPEEARHQTFSAEPRPSRPEGFTRRMRMRIPKATASRQEELVYPETSCSASPSKSPPSIAPGTFPIPPSTAATKALSPGISPISGCTLGYFEA